ncbi:hypothetical protein [Peterkaempfera griseoplana]|uniref:hypothetical protein n=1 Tax=Peterkaempfera griseoplana TaxID=66896 RepID=UPI0012FF5158|nr:hypothetical protein [Peterkaempfera griseoplana]
MTTALDTAISGMAAAQQLADQAQQLAQEHGLSIDDAGRVGLPWIGVADWSNPPVNAAMAAQKMIYQARFVAATVDDKLVPLLAYADTFEPDDCGPWQQRSRDIPDSVTEAVEETNSIIKRTAELPDPSDPNPDTAPQPYGVEFPGPTDLASHAKMQSAGLAYMTAHGWFNAGALLANWLANTGLPRTVNPDDMISAMPTFARSVQNALQARLEGVYDSGWHNYSPGDAIESSDWYYAFNDFRWRLVGLIKYDSSGGQRVEYSVGVRKPYVFGRPRRDIVKFGVVVAGQEELKHLHTTALAQNFIAQGISHTGPLHEGMTIVG